MTILKALNLISRVRRCNETVDRIVFALSFQSRAMKPETNCRCARMVMLLLVDKTIRLLFPGTLSINGNIYCSPKGRETGSMVAKLLFH